MPAFGKSNKIKIDTTNKVKVLKKTKDSSATSGWSNGVGESEIGLSDNFSSSTEVGHVQVLNTEKKEKGKNKKYTTVRQFTRDYIPNPLHDFQTYNTVFTLAALTKEEVNFPDVLFNRMPKFPVAHSSGKGNIKEVTFYKDIGVNLEYFIDEVDINAIVSPTQKNKHTQFTTMNFMIKEPFSIGLLLQTLNIQAAKAADDGEVNYTKAPYGLIIDFIGLDANGKIFRNEKLRKVLPFYFTKAAVRADTSGAVYECSAVPITEYGTMTINNQINTDIKLSGNTVYEMMQVGPNSLMAQLNFKGEDDKKAKKKEKPSYVPADDTVIYFPKGIRETLSEEQRKVILKDRAVANFADTGDDVAYTSAFKTESRDEAVETLLGNNVSVTNEYTGTGGQGIRVFQTEGEGSNATFLGNEVGAAKMAISENNMAIIGKTFPEFEEKYNKRKKTFTRDNITLDLKQMTLSFTAGSYITDIIETVILLSEYSLNLVKAPDEIKNKEKGSHPWFRIVPKCFELKDSFHESLVHQSPKVVVFSVVPYQVPDDLFIDPTTYPEGTTTIRNNIVKGFNYLYTGDNKDILDFQLDYNFGFYNSVPANLGKDASSSSADKNKTDANSSTVTEKTIYTITPSRNDLNGTQTSSGLKGENKQRGDGTENESMELKIARAMNDRIINSNVDLIKLDLTIIGDPYFLPTSGMMNSDEQTRYFVDPRSYYTDKGDLTATGRKYMGNGRAELNYMDRMCYVEVNFQTPIDYEKNGDNFIFPNTGGYVNGMGEHVRLGEFSGLYRVITLANNFRQGKFEQVLTIIRSGNTTIDAKEGSTENTKQIQEVEGQSVA
tara:strand:+ start:18 stop:2513 length:2496 start_codon:yes stop_codon:yes gene_type:complete